jgi:hypothetical protein
MKLKKHSAAPSQTLSPKNSKSFQGSKDQHPPFSKKKVSKGSELLHKVLTQLF